MCCGGRYDSGTIIGTLINSGLQSILILNKQNCIYIEIEIHAS